MSVLAASWIAVTLWDSSRDVPPARIFHVGDDGLTARLSDEIGRHFPPAPEGEGMAVTISEHVGWRVVGNRTRISYRVTLGLASRTSRIEGSCWENAMSKCVDQIVHAAIKFSRD
jgi:hypothetical protein